jgi:hypothetical protein
MLLKNIVKIFLKDEVGLAFTTVLIITTLVGTGIGLYTMGKMAEPHTYTNRDEEIVAYSGEEFLEIAVPIVKEGVKIVADLPPGVDQIIDFEGTSSNDQSNEIQVTNPDVPGSGQVIKIRETNKETGKVEEVTVFSPDSTILKVAQESTLRRITESDSQQTGLWSDMIKAVAGTYDNWSQDLSKTSNDYWNEAQKILESIKTAADLEAAIKEDLKKQQQLASDELMEIRKRINLARRNVESYQNEINALEDLKKSGYILGVTARRDLENRQRWVADLQGLVTSLEVKEKELTTQVAASTSVTIEGNREIFIDLTGDTNELTHLFIASAKPDDAYRFEWQFGDGNTASANLKPGEKSSESHTYTGLIAGGTLKPVVNLYDDAGNLLGSDTITINIRGAEFALQIRAPQVIIDGGGVIDTNYTFEAVGTGGIPDTATFKWKIDGGETGSYDSTLTTSFNSVGDYTFECSASWSQRAADGSSYEERVAAEPIVVSINEALEDVEERHDEINICGEWKASRSGGAGTTITNVDISQLPVGASFDLRFNAMSIPDKFIVEYEGAVVFDSGWRGDQSYVESNPDKYPGGLSGSGAGTQTAMFEKNSDNIFKVTVEGPLPNTAWDFALMANCPPAGE